MEDIIKEYKLKERNRLMDHMLNLILEIECDLNEKSISRGLDVDGGRLIPMESTMKKLMKAYKELKETI